MIDLMILLVAINLVVSIFTLLFLAWMNRDLHEWFNVPPSVLDEWRQHMDQQFGKVFSRIGQVKTRLADEEKDDQAAKRVERKKP